MPVNRLLIVDDEPRTLNRLTRVLRAQFDIVSAGSGQEGLDRFSAEGPFAVVMSDMRMPEMDGTAFLGRIQELAPDTVRILLSEYLDLEAVISAVNEGTIFQVLIKPAAPKVLASTLKEAFDRYRLMRRDHHQLQSKLEEETLEVDLVQGVLETLEMLKVTGLFKRTQVETVLPPGPVRVRMSRCQLEQVLLNLLRNACDALAEVPDRPDHCRDSGRILVLVEAGLKANLARCAVHDTGCGIPTEQREAIFQPYYTTKPPLRGTGLGLSVVKQIVESCGGSIRVESQPEQGSTFCVEFPMMGA